MPAPSHQPTTTSTPALLPCALLSSRSPAPSSSSRGEKRCGYLELPASQPSASQPAAASADPTFLDRLSISTTPLDKVLRHLPPTSYLLPPTCYLLPPTSYHLPPTSCLLPPTSRLLPPTTYVLPPTSYHLPPTSYLLPPTSYLLVVTSHLLPSTPYSTKPLLSLAPSSDTYLPT